MLEIVRIAHHKLVSETNDINLPNCLKYMQALNFTKMTERITTVTDLTVENRVEKKKEINWSMKSSFFLLGKTCLIIGAVIFYAAIWFLFICVFFSSYKDGYDMLNARNYACTKYLCFIENVMLCVWPSNLWIVRIKHEVHTCNVEK